MKFNIFTPNVSVIIPNYNHAKYLEERIQSVLNQSYNDFELILLDDCSNDNSSDIICKYKNNPHVSHIILNENNTGNTFVQWKRGVDLSNGKYIWIAESDDVADPDFLSTLIPFLEQDDNSSFVFSYSYLIDESSKVIGDWHDKTNDYSYKKYLKSSFSRKVMLHSNNIYNTSMVVFRKDLFHKIDDDYLKYRHCGDWLFWMRMSLQGNVYEVKRHLNYFRQHTNRVTYEAGNTGKDWEEVAEILSLFPDLLNLSRWMRSVFRGQWTMHFAKSNYHNKVYLKNKYPKILNGNLVNKICYKLYRLLIILRY